MKTFNSKQAINQTSHIIRTNKSWKQFKQIKNEVRQILYLLYQQKNHQKSLQQFNQVMVIMEENMILIRDPKTFYFNFNQPKYVDDNLKHGIEFIIKSNESLAENKINEIK